jgi:hypothetical protein
MHNYIHDTIQLECAFSLGCCFIKLCIQKDYNLLCVFINLVSAGNNLSKQQKPTTLIKYITTSADNYLILKVNS